jgi:hypothetical protein
LCIIAQATQDAYPDLVGKPYAMAERISAGLWADDVELGRQAIANKLLAAQELVTRAKREAA